MMKVIARQLRLVTLLTVGWGLQAQAQPTDFSLPPLPNMATTNSSGLTGSMPPLPSTPVAPNAGAKKEAVAQSEVADQPAPIAIPELANLPTPSDPSTGTSTTSVTQSTGGVGGVGGAGNVGPNTTTTAATETGDAPVSLPPAPAMPTVNESADAVAGETGGAMAAASATGLNVSLPPSTLPGLNTFPVAPTQGATGQSQQSQPATMLGEVDVEAPAPAPKTRTWKTRLAPVQQASTRGFNYRRQVLPDTIYRKSYDKENQHLPRQVTREDYVQLLIQRVASNDINGTRALLNEGISVNTMDGSGQTLLNVARRSGARDTERLLIARGAS